MSTLLLLAIFLVAELARAAPGNPNVENCKNQGYDWATLPADRSCMSVCYNNIGGTTVGDDYCAYTTQGPNDMFWTYQTYTAPMGLSPFAVGTQTCKKTDSNNICTLWKSEIHYDTCKKYVVHPQWSAVAYGTDYKSEISYAECRPGFEGKQKAYYSAPGGPFMRYCYGAEVTMKGPNDTSEDSASPTPTPTPVTTDKVVGEEFDLRIRVFGSVPNFQATSTTPEEDNNNPWVGIYKDGQTPGTDSSTYWEWISESFRYGEPLGPFSLAEPGYYFTTIFADRNSYKELVLERMYFTVVSEDGTAPTAPPITAPEWVSPQESVPFTYSLGDPKYYPSYYTYLGIHFDDGGPPNLSNEKGFHRIEESNSVGSKTFSVPSGGWTPGRYYVVVTTQGYAQWENDYVEVSDRVYVAINDGTTAPTPAPSNYPTLKPTKAPTLKPTLAPTQKPTFAPTTSSPTRSECTNGVKSGDETDVDCGGDCGGCEVNKACLVDGDCKSDTCLSNVCVAAPTVSPTPAITQAPTTSAPTKTPTKAPTDAPTQAPTDAPTQAPTRAPTPSAAPTTSSPTPLGYIVTCDETNKCWTGKEACCETISTNMFVTSVITERILFYDLKSSAYKKFLSHEAEQEGEDESGYKDDGEDDRGRGDNKGGGDGGGKRRLMQESAGGTGRRLNDDAFKSSSHVLEMDKTSHGTSQIAFSPSGSELYFTRSASALNDNEGSLEAFHAQTGEHVNTVISSSVFQSLSGSTTAFDPRALRVFSDVFSDNTVMIILFSDKATKSIYFFEPRTEHFTTTVQPPCTVVDIAVQKKGDGEIVALILSQCLGENAVDTVHKVVFQTGWDADADSLHIITSTKILNLPVKCDGRSIEFKEIDDWSHYWVALSPHASLLAADSQQPYIYEFSAVSNVTIDDLLTAEPILTFADLDNSQRLGVDLGMIRRAPNGKIYATEKTFGLPLILDPSLSESRVIGQTGAQHGDLADSYSVAFNPNTFGLNSEVLMGAEFDLTNNTIMAGIEYLFNVTLKNSENEDVLVDTFLEGLAEGMSSHGRSEVGIPYQSFERVDDTNVYQGKLMIETASQSAQDEDHKWQMKVEIKGLSMLIGNPVKFWVQAGPTSAKNTRLKSTYENEIAGHSTKIHVSTADQFGNQRNFNDTKGDEEDVNKFILTDISSGATEGDFEYTVSNIESGVFELDILTTKARAYTFEVVHGNEIIGNSPANVIFSPAAVNASKSVAVGSSLEFFEGNSDDSNSDVESENFFIVYLRDDFNNIVPSASFMDRINCNITGFRPVQSKAINIYDTSKNLNEELAEEAIAVEMESQSDGSVKVSYKIESRKYKYAVLTATWEGEEEDGGLDFIRYERVKDRTRELVELNEFRLEPYSVVEFRTVEAIDVYIVTLLTGFVVLFTIVLLILVQWWRKENAIKFSQRRLLLLLLLGCLIINLTMVLVTVPVITEWEWSCTMNVGGLCIGFELVMLTLLAKLYRVKTLAFAKANKKVKVTDGFLLVRIAVAMVLLIIYLGAASWIERIKLLNRVTEDVMRTDSKGTKYYYEIQACSYFETIVWLPLYFMQLVLIFLVAIMAFQTRKLSTAFSESRYIFHAINNLVLCLLLVGILVYDPDMPFKSPEMYLMAQYVPMIMGILVFEAVMFIPKFRFILRGTKIELTDLTRGHDKSGMEMGPMHLGRGESVDTFDSKDPNQLLDFRKSNSGGSGGVGVKTGNFQKKSSGFVNSRISSELSNFSATTDNPLAIQQQIDKEVKKQKERLEKKHQKELEKLKQLVVTLQEEVTSVTALTKANEESLGRSTERTASTVHMDMPDEGSQWVVDHDSNGYPFYIHPDGRCQYERPKDWWV
ncbi:hypothetical protein TrLO_g10538 [Triparma laevis f. longispina]|uniref:G-protein coupled receptors family 3 profile domain-containing protein n=1 Tax=Triparma laevis f. longispina TaxID=1714387 RepID=A0A9W7FRH1_9STRA|nr:hypothetical protein TrLO_g10538 [Triparma laevis f. longispina]